MLSCRLTSAPLWLGIYLFLWWFLFVSFGLFLLHWRYELPCQDKLPEFHCTPILGCIGVFWLVFHPLGLRLDKALCGWNSVVWFFSKGFFIRLKYFLNIFPWICNKGSIFISGVSTSKVIIDWSNSFQFKFVFFLECVTEGFWIFHTYGQVINIYSNVFIMTAIL